MGWMVHFLDLPVSLHSIYHSSYAH